MVGESNVNLRAHNRVAENRFLLFPTLCYSITHYFLLVFRMLRGESPFVIPETSIEDRACFLLRRAFVGWWTIPILGEIVRSLKAAKTGRQESVKKMGLVDGSHM